MTSALRLVGGLQQPLLGAAEALLAPWRKPPAPVVLPCGFEPMPATPKKELERILTALRQRAPAWAKTSPADRARLLRACLDTTLQVCEEAAQAATQAKGSWGFGIGEDLLAWVPVVSALREYAEACEAGGQPRPHGVRRRPDGQAVVDTFPLGLEALLYGKFHGEIWILPGQEPTQGRLYRDKAAGARSEEGGVGLVLGAGNQLPVATLDILHKLVVDDEVVVCKMNPVNEYLGSYIRRAFQPLVDAGFLEVVYGGGDVGALLCNSPDVASIHLTGSAATYDAIVWQGKDKAKEAAGHPEGLLGKPVGAELGCVTPYIIVPGPWSSSDLEYHAESVACGLTNNAGHNCLKAELVVTDAGWPLRHKFLAALRRRLAAQPNRVAYYPGSDRKLAAFRQRFPDAEEIGGGVSTAAEGGGADGAVVASTSGRVDMKVVPWLLMTGLSPDEAATQDENWCGVLQEVALPGCGSDPAAFMAAAAAFANDRCWGTLSCAVFVHPATRRKHGAAYDGLIAGLRYGAIAVNCPGTMSFAITRLGWGAFPGGSPTDIGSGNCFVHNTLLLDHVQKSVLTAPWRFHPYPMWAPSHRNPEAVARHALAFCAAPSVARVLPLAGQALRG